MYAHFCNNLKKSFLLFIINIIIIQIKSYIGVYIVLILCIFIAKMKKCKRKIIQVHYSYCEYYWMKNMNTSPVFSFGLPLSLSLPLYPSSLSSVSNTCSRLASALQSAVKVVVAIKTKVLSQFIFLWRRCAFIVKMEHILKEFSETWKPLLIFRLNLRKINKDDCMNVQVWCHLWCKN